MMSFCQKAVHTFLGLSNSKDPPSPPPPPPESASRRRRNNTIPSSSVGTGLSLIAVETKKPVNVLESATVKPVTTTAVEKKAPNGIGFLDDISISSFDGLMSCTESLGFESSDERRSDDNQQQMESEIDEAAKSRSIIRSKWRNSNSIARAKRHEMKFPPPLPSLNRHGQPNFFLKSVRKNGRLELTEIRIDRPEILRASRHDGRLKLQFIIPDSQQQNDDEEEEEEKIQEQQKSSQIEEEFEEEEEEEEKIQEQQKSSQIEEEFEEEEEVRSEKVGEENVRQWQFPVTTGDGFRRCQELSSHHHHHHHHHNYPLWSQHCVTIR